MITESGIEVSRSLKEFLELVQPLPVWYGYSRAIRSSGGIVTFRETSNTPSVAVGGRFISERTSFIVTVQTKTAASNIICSALIRYATQGSMISIVSEDMRKDVTVEDGWINTLIVSVYNAAPVAHAVFTRHEAQDILLEVATLYNAVREKHGVTGSQFSVQMLTNDSYTYAQVMNLKKPMDTAFVSALQL